MNELLAVIATTGIIGALLAVVVWLARLNGKQQAILEAGDVEADAMAEMDAQILAVRESVRTDNDATIRDRLRRNATED